MKYNNYLIETQYSLDPNTFVLTRGGYYKSKDKNTFNVTFEFNSNFENDQLKNMTIVKDKSWKYISKSKYFLICFQQFLYLPYLPPLFL